MGRKKVMGSELTPDRVIGGLSILRVAFLNDDQATEILNYAISLIKDQQETIDKLIAQLDEVMLRR